MAAMDIATLPVPPLEGEQLLKQGVTIRYTHFAMLTGTLRLTNRRIVLRDGFMWLIAKRTHVFELPNVSVGDSHIPWYLKPYAWLGGVWWIESGGKRLSFTGAWGSRWIQDIRKAQGKLNR